MQITFGDHFKALRAVTWRTMSTRFAYVFFLGVPLIVVVLVVAIHPHPLAFLLKNWTGVVAGPAFIFVFLPLLQLWTVYSHRKHNAALRGTQVYEFVADGIVMRGDLHSTELNWNALFRVVETREFLLLYHSKAAAHFLPKRALASDAQLKDLRQIFWDHLHDRARLLVPFRPAAA